MDIRQDMYQLVRKTIELLEKKSAVNWPSVLARFRCLHDQVISLAAKTEDFDGGAESIVSCANLLTDCAQNVLDCAKVATALECFDPLAKWEEGMVELFRQGETVILKSDTDASQSQSYGVTAMDWQRFLNIFGIDLGAHSKAQKENLWHEIQDEDFRMKLAKVNLGHPRNQKNTWVTDDDDEGKKLLMGDPTSQIYDGLGLDWSRISPEKIDPDGKRTVRAVLICCPMTIRAKASRGIRCPTGADGWGNLLFHPRKCTGEPWPKHGSATARPNNPAPSNPEAIHGHVQSGADEVLVLPVHRIHIGRRFLDCGPQVMAMAISRLEEAVVT